MKKRLFSRIAAFSVTLVLFSGIPKAAAAQFSDVPNSYWANKEIEYVVSKGLFNGTSDTMFSPEAPMKRGQLAAVLYRYAGSPMVTGENFDDVDSNSYYADACLWARLNGIFMVEKYTSPILKPNEAISRSEFATMLYNFAKLDGRAETKTPVTGYQDMQSASDEIKESMLAWAVPNGVMNGTSTATMNPYGGIKRAHVAAMLYRYEQLPKGEPLPEEEPEAPVKKDVYGTNDKIPFKAGHYKAQIAIGEKIYVGEEALGCDNEYMVEKTMDRNGLGAVGKVAGKTTLFVPERGNPRNERWITVELTITEKPGVPVEIPETPEPPVKPEISEKPSSSQFDEAEVYEKIMALKSEYPEGMTWTNENKYKGAGGCAAFGYICADAAFGSPTGKHINCNAEEAFVQAKVGDRIRIGKDQAGWHTIVVLKKDHEGIFTAEGNAGSAITYNDYWYLTDLEREGVVYLETNY